MTATNTEEYLAAVEGEQVKINMIDSSRLLVDQKEYLFDFAEIQPGEFSLLLNGTSFRVLVVNKGSKNLPDSYNISVNGKEYDVELDDKRSLLLKSLSGAASQKSDTVTLSSPMPGLVVKVEVRGGDDVVKGQGLVVLEAMKMENELKAAANGKVLSVHVTAGAKVEKGERLISIRYS